MVAAPAVSIPSATTLQSNHYEHLRAEGFTDDDITTFQGWGVRSLSRRESELMKLGAHSGLYFPFSATFGQLRLDNPIIKKGEDPVKYKGQYGTAVMAWRPPGNKWDELVAGTEGWKDAAKPTRMGAPTMAFAGVSNLIYSVPRGCKLPIIFDSDGWRKHTVMSALVDAAIWTHGKIALFPKMENFPNGGACEFFKVHSDKTVEAQSAAYTDIVKNALTPSQFIDAWVEGIGDYDLTGMFGGKSHEDNYGDSIRAVLKCVKKLQSANDWERVLQANLEAHRKEYGV